MGPVLIFLAVLVALYALQMLLALLNAWRKTGDRPSVLKQLFGGLSELTGTWATIGIILVLPVVISWMSSISDEIFLKLDSGLALFEACLSMLLVLITLEFSLLNSLNHRNRRQWRGLLLYALALDIISIAILVWIKIMVSQQIVPGWSGVFYFMLTLGIAALLSSFLVILFAKRAGEPIEAREP